MADPFADPRDESRARPPGVPVWVKMLGIIALALGATLVIVMLLVGGDHGPGQHDAGADALPVELVFVAGNLNAASPA